ncbi:MAG: hypothetical protein KDC76_00510 [Bacteroidetes bacterium]|nr:hypothetical protein [Bacteroidota bacterium]
MKPYALLPTLLPLMLWSCQSGQQPVEETTSLTTAFEQCETINSSQGYLLEMYDELKDVDLILLNINEDQQSTYERVRLNRLTSDSATVIGFIDLGSVASGYPITKTYHMEPPKGEVLVLGSCFDQVLNQHPDLKPKLYRNNPNDPEEIKNQLVERGMDYDSLILSIQNQFEK